MDEFLVSGETLVRNLQAGIATRQRLRRRDGRRLPARHVRPRRPDAPAPRPGRVRARGGVAGVPSAVDRTAFRWAAPDGSTVRAEYLVAGYGNGAALPDDAKALVRRLARPGRGGRSVPRPTGIPLLLMNGTDHQRPQPWLGRVVAEANQIQDDFELAITVAARVPRRGTDATGCPSGSGELRSGARANLLMGVASNRVDVKQAAARAERALERLAEPLSALFLPADELAGTLPRRRLDADHPQLGPRLDLRLLGRRGGRRRAPPLRRGPPDRRGAGRAGARTASAASMASTRAGGGQPDGRDRRGLVEVVVPAVGEPGPDVQVLSERAGLPGTVTLDGDTVRSMLGHVQGARIDNDTYITDVTLTEDETGLDITIVDRHRARERRPGRRGQARALHPPHRPARHARCASRSTSPRSGGSSPARTRSPGSAGRTSRRPVSPTGAGYSGDPDRSVTLDNGLVTVAVDPADGTFSLDGVPGYGRLVDGGDHGDTYNYSPPAARLRGRHARVGVGDPVGRRGPVRATASITATFAWPDRVDGRPRRGSAAHAVDGRDHGRGAGRRAGGAGADPFDNPSRDHRLRVHLPLPRPAATSQAECAFTVVERGPDRRGTGGGVRAPRPSPRGGSSRPGGLTVVHEGLLEYELVDIDGGPGRPVSREPPPWRSPCCARPGCCPAWGCTPRPLPAGPMTPVEGRSSSDRSTCATPSPWASVDPYAMADDVLVPLATAWVRSAAGTGRPRLRPSPCAGPRSRRVRPAGPACSRSGCSTPGSTPTTVEIADRTRLAGRPPRTAAGPLRGVLRAPRRRDRHRPARPTEPDPAGRQPVGAGLVRRHRPTRRRLRSTVPHVRRARRARAARRRAAPSAWSADGRCRARSPARASFQAWTRPMSFKVRGPQRPSARTVDRPRATSAVRNSSETSTVPGCGHADQPAGQVDHRAVVVAVLHQHRADGEGHPDVGEQLVPGVGLGQAQPDLGGAGGRSGRRTSPRRRSS